MRFPGAACPVLLSALAGCSVLYNPSDLPAPRIDAAPPPDMPTDSNLRAPRVEEVGPRILLEGQGTGGSRPAILTLLGANLGRDATISIAPTAGPDSTLQIQVDNANAVGSASGRALAVPVTLAVDPAHGSDGASDVLLTVTLTQTSDDGQPVTLQVADQVVLRNLPELTAPVTEAVSPPVLYSQVEVSAPISFNPRKGAPAAVIRAVGSVTLGDVKADGSGDTPGPGGGVGGSSQGPARGGGVGGGGPAVLLAVGSTASGGGYGTAGGDGVSIGLGTPVEGGMVSGDDLITSYASNTSGGGGGGGSAGGGGGGTLEITAGGTLRVGKVTANGARGTNNSGGGSGGAIVLRSGAVATLDGDVLAVGGGAANNVSVGGQGRIRFDVPVQVGTPAILGARRAGVSFDLAAGGNPLVATTPEPELSVLSTAGSAQFSVVVLTANNTTSSSTSVTFGSTAAVFRPTLIEGFNRVCVSPPQGNPTLVESTTCIDIAYVP